MSGRKRPVCDRTAALARNDEGKILARMLVPILQAGPPHHDAVVEQRAVAFPQAVHLLHHVGELRDIECRDRGDLADLFRLVVVMSLGVMLVVESKFRIGSPVRRRADVGADTSRVRLERQHVEVAHHLHVLAPLVAFRNLDLDRQANLSS